MKSCICTEFEQALIIVKLFRGHSRENNRRERISTVTCVRSLEESGQITMKTLQDIGCEKVSQQFI